MTNTRRLFLASGLAIACMVGFPALATEPIKVTASFSILGDLVRVVGGDRVAVATLVGPDEDVHTFEPKPAQAKAILNARLLVTNGLGFELWVNKLANATDYKGSRAVASTGVTSRLMADEQGHAEPDPHAWQNPNNVVLYVRNIAAALSAIDASGASIYQANAQAYIKELQALDAWSKAQFSNIPVAKRKVITSHDAFGYFAAQYRIKFLAPRGVNTRAEPSPKEVEQLITQMKREKIRAVFLENLSNPKLIAQLSKDAGATLGPSLYADALSAVGTPGATYLQMMRHNVTQLVAGMKLN